MRLTIFGATGRTGEHLVRQSLEEGHDVTAVVRDPARLDVSAHERLRVLTADVTDPAAVGPAVEGADAVLSALGPIGRAPSTVCEESARAIIAAMGKAGVRRLVVCSASGPFTDAGDGPITRYLFKPILGRILKEGFNDMRRCETEVRACDLDWTIVRPSQLTDKAPIGRYRTATDVNLRRGLKICRADLAAAMLGLIADESSVHHHVSVAY